MSARPTPEQLEQARKALFNPEESWWATPIDEEHLRHALAEVDALRGGLLVTQDVLRERLDKYDALSRSHATLTAERDEARAALIRVNREEDYKMADGLRVIAEMERDEARAEIAKLRAVAEAARRRSREEAVSAVWVVTAVSESSDHYGPFVFDHKPAPNELKALFRKEAPGEWEPGGPGDWGSWLYVTTTQARIRARGGK